MLLPPTVVTVTLTAPALPAGLLTVIVAPLSLVSLVTAVVPNLTVAFSRFDPSIVTSVPPASGPAVGKMLVMLGAATYVN